MTLSSRPGTLDPYFVEKAVPRRFKMLRLVAYFFLVFAVITLFVGGVIATDFTISYTGRYSYLFEYNTPVVLVDAGIVFFGALIIAGVFAAAGQGILLLIALEHNQRVQTELQSRYYSQQLGQ